MREELQTELKKMQDALALLNSAGSPAEIGAHLDLTIVRLEAFISQLDDHEINAQYV